ncbi:hypothetical protein DNJ95_18875, partial [Stutzerimonas kirkiae]|uniref:peptidoglycan-binding domain-containing protein n=1 Tax=Stutzerimonas kirkiae TaxID=2211392 RepID=UPI0010D171F9
GSVGPVAEGRAQVSPPPDSPLPVAPAEPVIQAGQCWVYAQVKPKPVQSTLDVVIKDSVNRISVTPAELQNGLTQVVTREGTRTYRIEPPTYRQVSERVEVRPEVKRYTVVPAVYEEHEQTVTLEEARTVLDPCRTAGTRYARESGVMAFCAREVPAQTRTLKTQVLVAPESVREDIEPAVFETVTRWVVDKPAQAVEVLLEPELAQLRVEQLVRPVQASQVVIAEKTQRLQVTRFDGEARIVSRQAVCDADIDEGLVRRLQSVLAQRGFPPGRIDGLLGRRTLAALMQFQEHGGLAVGALTLESVAALGLD